MWALLDTLKGREGQMSRNDHPFCIREEDILSHVNSLFEIAVTRDLKT